MCCVHNPSQQTKQYKFKDIINLNQPNVEKTIDQNGVSIKNYIDYSVHSNTIIHNDTNLIHKYGLLIKKNMNNIFISNDQFNISKTMDTIININKDSNIPVYNTNKKWEIWRFPCLFTNVNSSYSVFTNSDVTYKQFVRNKLLNYDDGNNRFNICNEYIIETYNHFRLKQKYSYKPKFINQNAINTNKIFDNNDNNKFQFNEDEIWLLHGNDSIKWNKERNKLFEYTKKTTNPNVMYTNTINPKIFVGLANFRTYKTKFDVTEYPLETVRYTQHKWKLIDKYILYAPKTEINKSSYVFGESNHYDRIEQNHGDYQHKHSLIWFKNCDLNINKDITTQLRNTNGFYPLPKVFFDRQIHRCSDLCLNKDGKCSEHYPNKIHNCDLLQCSNCNKIKITNETCFNSPYHPRLAYINESIQNFIVIDAESPNHYVTKMIKYVTKMDDLELSIDKFLYKGYYPFRCNVCNEIFNDDAYKHINKCNNKFNYSCTLCNKNMNTTEQLLKHAKTCSQYNTSSNCHKEYLKHLQSKMVYQPITSMVMELMNYKWINTNIKLEEKYLYIPWKSKRKLSSKKNINWRLNKLNLNLSLETKPYETKQFLRKNPELMLDNNDFIYYILRPYWLKDINYIDDYSYNQNYI